MKRFVLLTALVLASALYFAGCGGGESDESAADSSAADTSAADTTAAAPKPEKAIRVNAGLVRNGVLVQPVYADGVLRTTQQVEVSSKLGGELVAVRVRDGERVRAGQLLARLDDREYALALEEARYRHIQALSEIAAEGEEQVADQAALAAFVEQRDALLALRTRREISEEEFQARLLDLELASLKDGAFRQDTFAQRTGLADARIAEERARINLEYTEIRAPFAGVISGLAVVKGQNISVGQALCSITDDTELEAVVNVLEADLGDLAEGRAALVEVPAVDDTIRAVVDVISPVLDETSRTCQVIIRFPNDERRYRPGMFVRAEVAARLHADRLLVPRESVLTRDDRTLLFKVIEGPRAQWLYVDTGLENSEWIEILKVHSGGSLAADEKVVVSDHLTLAHEAKLKIRKTVPASDRWAFATEGSE